MSNLKNKIKAGQFVITAEIVPPLSAAGTKLLHEAGQLADDGGADLDGLGVAVEGDHVAAQEDIAGELLLERLEHVVLGARQLGGDADHVHRAVAH